MMKRFFEKGLYMRIPVALSKARLGIIALACACVVASGMVGCAGQAAQDATADVSADSSAAAGATATAEAGSSAADGASSASSDAADEQARSLLETALAKSFSSVSFDTRTEASATGVSDGQMQQQTMTETSQGELERSDVDVRMHMHNTHVSTSQLERSSYDLYLSPGELIASQNDQLFGEELTDEDLDSFVEQAIGPLVSEKALALVDCAYECSAKESDGKTVVSLAIDPARLPAESLANSSALPDGAAIATLVASFSIDETDRIDTVRIIGGTTGTPSYHITQTYRYFAYDETELPAWPDVQAYLAEQAGIQIDEEGRLFIVGDDGQAYYIDSINEDGSIELAAE